MAQNSASLVGRRSVLVSLGALAGATAFSGVAVAASRVVGDVDRDVDRGELPAPGEVGGELAAAPQPATTLFGLPAGARLGSWTVEAVLPVTLGSIPVVLRTRSGARVQVDVVRRDPVGPNGIASTHHFSVFLANQGDGATATDEDAGRGAMMVARYLALRERDIDVPPSLLTFSARAAAHPGGAFLV